MSLISRRFRQITTSSITSASGSCDDPLSLFKLPYFDGSAFLVQTSQIQLEYVTIVTGEPVWTITRSFRAEPKVDDRHLTEFTLVECEAPHCTLDQLMDLEEALITCLVGCVRDNPVARRVASDARLGELRLPFRRMTYEEAIAILTKLGVEIAYGDDIRPSDELRLLESNDGQPMFVTHYPIEIKYFNMKWSENGRTVQNVDLLLPPFGEVTGGAVREENIARLKRNIARSPMFRAFEQMGAGASDFDSYLSLWDEDNVIPRAGFGLGLERVVGFLTDTSDIRNCTIFPRNRELLDP